MITLTEYTTYAEVRAVLGVSAYELPDDVLALPNYTRALFTKLYATTGTFGSVTGSLVDIFDALSVNASPTAEEEHMLSLIQQFATHVVAEACLSGLSLLVMKTESDGEAIQTRFSSEATFGDVAKNVRQQITGLLSQIDSALGAETYVLPLLAAIQPVTDVVTNESA